MNKLSTVLVVILVSADGCHALFETREKARAQGRLLCNGEKLTGASIRLMEDDTADMDDFIEVKYTDRLGAFDIEGTAVDTALTSTTPYLIIDHTCGGNNCFKVTMKSNEINLGDVKLPYDTRVRSITCWDSDYPDYYGGG